MSIFFRACQNSSRVLARVLFKLQLIVIALFSRPKLNGPLYGCVRMLRQLELRVSPCSRRFLKLGGNNTLWVAEAIRRFQVASRQNYCTDDLFGRLILPNEI